MKRIKVLMFSVSAGGVKQHIVDLTSRLDRTRFDVVGAFPDQTLLDTVVNDPESKYSEIFKKLGLRYYPIEIPRNLNLKADLAGFFKLVGVLRRERPDILHCHSSMAGAIGRVAGRLCRVPLIVYTPHNMYYRWQTGWKKWFYLQMEKILYYFTDHLVLVSASEYEEAADALPGTDRLVCINNGVDCDMFEMYQGNHRGIHESLGIDEDTIVILSVTRLDPQKDIFTLLRAVERLDPGLQKFKLLVAGDGEEAEACMEFVRRNNLADRITFLGWRDDVYDLIFASDVMVLSSRKEGMAYSVLEASAMSKPQIGSDVPGIKDGIINGRTGFLFEAGDDQALAKHLKTLLLDADLRETLGRNGKEFVRTHFSLQGMVEQSEALYNGNFR